MIKASVKRDENGIIYGFKIINHGDELVCSAVSTLALNTFNSIEELTETNVTVNFDENGGFLDFHIEDYQENGNDALLLLRSLHLGLSCLEMEHPKEVKLLDTKIKKKR